MTDDFAVSAAAEAASPDAALAYLILAHADPLHFGRLVARLSHPRVAIFAHVDGSAEIAPFRAAAERAGVRVVFCEKPVRVVWAGYSVVEATLRLVETALAGTGPGVGRFVLLSGADYPLAGAETILSFFDGRPGDEFIRGFDGLASHPSQIWKIRGRHLREWASRGSRWRPALYAVERMLRLFPKDLPKDIRYVVGSQWWALTRECCKACVTRARQDGRLVATFRSMFAPDEIFFHTLVHNSPFAKAASAIEPFNPRVLADGGMPSFANLHHLPNLTVKTPEQAITCLEARPRALFARKFASGESDTALMEIDRVIDADTKAIAEPRGNATSDRAVGTSAGIRGPLAAADRLPGGTNAIPAG